MQARRILVCAPRMPEYDREAGARHVFHLLEFLRQDGWAVSFIGHDANGGERYLHILQQMGVTTYAGPPTRWAGDEYLPSPHDLIANGHFDLAILWSWRIAEYYLPILRARSPRTRVIVDSGDLHFLREARSLLRKPAPDQAAGMLDRGYAHQMRRELNIYAAADAVITVSQKEADLIGDFTANPALAYAIPDTEDITASPIPFTERRGMLFIGGFLFAPNIDGLEYLCQDILPRIDQALLIEHPAYIVGYELQRAMQGHDRWPACARMVGWVPSVEPYLHQARVALIPLRYGAGTKRKLLQSLMAGTPSVSTSIGAEGLGLRDGEHVLLADDATAFAGAIARLLRDSELWHRLAAQGQAHALAIHAQAQVHERLRAMIAEVMAKPAPSASSVSGSRGVRRQLRRARQLWASGGVRAVHRQAWLRLRRVLGIG